MNDIAMVKVWDPLVRVFHWTLVGAVLIAWITEDHWMALHSFAGYLVLGLLLFRLLWGFVGPRYARFSDFARPPVEVITYFKRLISGRAGRYIGHNPAGGAMIVALLCLLLLTVVTGMLVYGTEGGGPLAGWLAGVGKSGEKMWEEVHEFCANATLVFAAVHVGGVLLHGWLHKENLVRSMFTGTKRAE